MLVDLENTSVFSNIFSPFQIYIVVLYMRSTGSQKIYSHTYNLFSTLFSIRISNLHRCFRFPKSSLETGLLFERCRMSLFFFCIWASVFFSPKHHTPMRNSETSRLCADNLQKCSSGPLMEVKTFDSSL